MLQLATTMQMLRTMTDLVHRMTRVAFVAVMALPMALAIATATVQPRVMIAMALV
jgi:hypothetical protein